MPHRSPSARNDHVSRDAPPVSRRSSSTSSVSSPSSARSRSLEAVRQFLGVHAGDPCRLLRPVRIAIGCQKRGRSAAGGLGGRVRVDRRTVVGVDLEVEVRDAAGVAGVAHVADDRAGRDVAGGAVAPTGGRRSSSARCRRDRWNESPPRRLPRSVTTPETGATTGVPWEAIMSTPLWRPAARAGVAPRVDERVGAGHRADHAAAATTSDGAAPALAATARRGCARRRLAAALRRASSSAALAPRAPGGASARPARRRTPT